MCTTFKFIRQSCGPTAKQWNISIVATLRFESVKVETIWLVIRPNIYLNYIVLLLFLYFSYAHRGNTPRETIIALTARLFVSVTQCVSSQGLFESTWRNALSGCPPQTAETLPLLLWHWYSILQYLILITVWAACVNISSCCIQTIRKRFILHCLMDLLSEWMIFFYIFHKKALFWRAPLYLWSYISPPYPKSKV